MLIYYQDLSEDFLREHPNYISKIWTPSSEQSFSEEFITEFENKLSLNNVLKTQELSEKFLRDRVDKFTHEQWRIISLNQKLSLQFLHDYKDKINWYMIAAFKELTLDFILEFKEQFKDNRLEFSFNQNLSPELLEQIKSINWEE